MCSCWSKAKAPIEPAVLERFQGRLLDAAGFAGGDYIIGAAMRDDATSRAISFLAWLVETISGRIDLSRLRSSFLSAMAAQIGLRAFMDAAGISCSQRLGDLVANFSASPQKNKPLGSLAKGPCGDPELRASRPLGRPVCQTGHRSDRGNLPKGARARQLSVRTLLLGMLLACADDRPAHLSRVHGALLGLRAEDALDWASSSLTAKRASPAHISPGGVHQLSCLFGARKAQARRGHLVTARRPARDAFGIKCSAVVKDTLGSLAVDWSDIRASPTRRPKKVGPAPIPRPPGGTGAAKARDKKTSCSSATTFFFGDDGQRRGWPRGPRSSCGQCRSAHIDATRCRASSRS